MVVCVWSLFVFGRISVKTLRQWEQQERQIGPGPGQVVNVMGAIFKHNSML